MLKQINIPNNLRRAKDQIKKKNRVNIAALFSPKALNISEIIIKMEREWHGGQSDYGRSFSGRKKSRGRRARGELLAETAGGGGGGGGEGGSRSGASSLAAMKAALNGGQAPTAAGGAGRSGAGRWPPGSARSVPARPGSSSAPIKMPCLFVAPPPRLKTKQKLPSLCERRLIHFPW